jgi:RNA polymerase sigma-70 factor (ECF subfamily)
VDELSPRLLGYALNLTGDGDEAADLLQETWIQAYRRRATFRGEGPLLGWLLTIAYHRFASDRRGEARRLARQVELASTTDSIGGAIISPDEGRIDTRQALAAALAELPERQRSVVVCRLLEDRSVRDTAVRLGIAEGTVKATAVYVTF